MESLFFVSPGAQDAYIESHWFAGRVLIRMITISFARPQGLASSFRDMFRDFAEAYFTLSREVADPLQSPAHKALAVDALARVLADAMESGQLVPHPPRLTANVVLTNLATLQKQLSAGTLAHSDAVDLITTMLFEGLQASPSLPA